MGQLDANRNANRAAVKKIIKGRRKRVHKAQHELLHPKPTVRPSKGSVFGTAKPKKQKPIKRSGQTPDRERRDAVGRGAQQRQAQRVTERDARQSVRRILSFHTGLRKKERAVQTATKAGVLPSQFESGKTRTERHEAEHAERLRYLQKQKGEAEADKRAEQRNKRHSAEREINKGGNVEELRAKGKLPSQKAGLGPKVGDPLHLRAAKAGTEHATLYALEKTARPGHAVIGAVNERVKGHSAASARKEFVKGLSGKQHTTGTDLLNSAGWHPHGIVGKVARSAAGFTIDVAGDPTTYATLGAASVAKTAAEDASRAAIRAGEKAARKASTAEEAHAIHQRAIADAEHAAHTAIGRHAGKGRGIQLGLRVPISGKEVRTSGRGTATIGRVVNRATKHAPGRKAGRKLADKVLPHIAPDYRKAGVSEAAHQGRRRAGVKFRAAVHRGQARAAHTEQSLQAVATETAPRRLKIGRKRRTVRDEHLRDITAAVERAPAHVPDLEVAVKPTPRHRARMAHNKAKRKQGTVAKREQRMIGRAERSGPQAAREQLAKARALGEPRKANIPNDAPAVLVRQLDHAHAEYKAASIAVSKAKMGHRNALTNPEMFSLPQKRAALDRAKTRLKAAKEELAHAQAAIDDAAERGAARHAAREAGTPISGHGAAPKRTKAQPDVERIAPTTPKGKAKFKFKTTTYTTRREAEAARKEAGRPAKTTGEPRDVHTPRRTPLDTIGRKPLNDVLRLDKAVTDRAAADADVEATKKAIDKTPATKRKRQKVVVTTQGQDYKALRAKLPKQTTPHTDVVEAVRRRNAERAASEVSRKILTQKQVDKYGDSYAHHRFEDILDENRKASRKRRNGGVSFAPGKQRDEDLGFLSARERNKLREAGGASERFEERISRIEGERELAHQQRTARSDYVDELLHAEKGGHAIPVTRDNVERLRNVPEDYGVYRRSGSDAIDELHPDEVKNLANGYHSLKKGDTLYVANRANMDAAREQIERTTRKSGLYRRMSGKWKSAVTMFNPSYHVGNEIGNRVMAWQADTSIRGWNSSRKAMNILGRRNKFERSAEAARGKNFRATLSDKDQRVLDLVGEAEAHGALSGGFTHELQDLRGHQTHRVARFGERRENHMRLASYISARRERGMTPDQAAEWVNKHHIDYGDLTPFEQSLRDIGVPFYTFTARNARLQASKLFQRPGKAASFEKLRTEISQLSDEDPDFARSLKRYQQAGAPFVLSIGGTKMLFFARTPIEQGLGQIPGNFREAGQQILSRGNPLVKMPIEAIANYNSFFRTPIEDSDPNSPFRYSPAPKWAEPLLHFPAAKNLLHLTKDDKGNLQWRGGATWALGILPQSKIGAQAFIGTDQATNNQTAAMSGAAFVGFKISDLNRSLISAARERTKEERDDVARWLDDAEHGRNGLRRTDPKFPHTNSQQYQDHADRKKELDERIKKLDVAAGYKPAVPPARVQSRPKSRQQEHADKRAKRQAERTPAGRAKKRADEQAAKARKFEARRILRGG